MFLRPNPATAKPTKMTQRMELAIRNGEYNQFLEEFEECGTLGIDNLDDLGRSALFIAVRLGKEDIAQFLMDHHADPFVNKKCQGGIENFKILLTPSFKFCSENFIKKVEQYYLQYDDEASIKKRNSKKAQNIVLEKAEREKWLITYLQESKDEKNAALKAQDNEEEEWEVVSPQPDPDATRGVITNFQFIKEVSPQPDPHATSGEKIVCTFREKHS